MSRNTFSYFFADESQARASHVHLDIQLSRKTWGGRCEEMMSKSPSVTLTSQLHGLMVY